MIQYPITPNEEQQIFEKANKTVEYNFSDFGTGFADENLLAIGANYLMENQDFPPDENYNPKEDQQIIPYADSYDMFMFSKSQAETTSIINNMLEEEEKQEKQAATVIHKKRTSSRRKKLSAAMRIVDAETRKAVMQARIDGLEGDNLFG